ncbi:MAG: hydrogenase maturation nickel metallochaperone HypA [bacterium]
MHEFSIAVNIVEIAEAEAVKAGADRITELVLDIGTLSGIEYDALDTAMEMAVHETMLEKSRIVVNRIRATAICKECRTEFELEQLYDACPACQSPFHEIQSGQELRIKSLVVDTKG